MTTSIGDKGRPGETGAAVKLDYGKAPVFSLFIKYFPYAVIAVTYVSEYGLRKYNPGGESTGWKEVPDGVNRYGDAAMRHILKEKIEGLYDDSDSGLAHAAQAAWNALARLETLIEKHGLEIRIGNEIKDKKPVLGTAHKI